MKEDLFDEASRKGKIKWYNQWKKTSNEISMVKFKRKIEYKNKGTTSINIQTDKVFQTYIKQREIFLLCIKFFLSEAKDYWFEVIILFREALYLLWRGVRLFAWLPSTFLTSGKATIIHCSPKVCKKCKWVIRTNPSRENVIWKFLPY